MAHQLTDELISRCRLAFALWDMGDGTIDARDFGRVMRHLGPMSTLGIPRVRRRPGTNVVKITFEEFLNRFAGPDWHPTAAYQDEEVLDAFAAHDTDGTGYISLQNLIRTLDEHLKDTDYLATDDQLVDLCNEALDPSMINIHRNPPQEMLRSIVVAELHALRSEQNQQCHSAVAGQDRSSVGAPSEPPVQEHASRHRQRAEGQDRVINVTVVDLRGKKLLSGTFAPHCTVQELQQYIEDAGSVHFQHQMLLLAGHVLSRKEATLPEVGISDGTSVALVAVGELKVNFQEFTVELLELL